MSACAWLPAPTRGAIVSWFLAAMLLAALILVRGGGWNTASDEGVRASGGAPRQGLRPLLARESFPIEHIDRIELVRGGARLVFERTEEGWQQREPFTQPADGGRLRELLLQLSDLRAARSVDPSTADLPALGLDPPQAELLLSWDGGRRRLALGHRGVGGRAWVRIDEGPAFASDASAHEAIIDEDPRGLRSWKLFDRISAATDRVVVRRSPVDERREPLTLELVRQEGRWSMRSPWRTRVDPEAAEGLLAALARAEHAGFIDDSPADLALYGLERPIATIEAWTPQRRLAGGQVRRESIAERVEIGSGLVRGGALAARRSDRPPVVLLDQVSLGALLPAPAALVDPRACGVPAGDIRMVRVRNPDGRERFQLERTLDGWLLREWSDGSVSDPVPANATAVQALVDRLTSARAPELAPQSMPPELIVAIVEVTPSVGSGALVRVAREGPLGKWALDESDDVLRVFPASFELPLEPAAFRGRQR